ncbi:MAG: PEP-CTERM sorting domain-containing protein [Akkermansiaceae bacterium]|nr:PEP-CTERM sorting domain-containing protein [Akkermansiaceae bacterium]
MKATDGTASAIQATYTMSGGLLGGVQATNSNMFGTATIGSGGLNMWKQTYGYDLDAAKTIRGWNENLILSSGGVAAPGNVDVTGFQANSSYTMSSVFTISGLANVATWGTNSPVNLTGSGIDVKNVYLAGTNGQVVDLLHIGSGSLATLLSSGTFMLTWQFETTSSFNPSSSISMGFSDSLLSVAGNYGVSALALRDGTPDLAVPEPATASLSLLGLAALLMRRRRSR